MAQALWDCSRGPSLFTWAHKHCSHSPIHCLHGPHTLFRQVLRTHSFFFSPFQASVARPSVLVNPNQARVLLLCRPDLCAPQMHIFQLLLL